MRMHACIVYTCAFDLQSDHSDTLEPCMHAENITRPRYQLPPLLILLDLQSFVCAASTLFVNWRARVDSHLQLSFGAAGVAFDQYATSYRRFRQVRAGVWYWRPSNRCT